MDTIVVVYTSMGGLINTMKKELSAALPDCRIVNIADDSLIREVVEHGRVTDRVRERMMHYFQAAARWDPKVIISACSSVGEVAEAADKTLSVPVIRIDRAMIKKLYSMGTESAWWHLWRPPWSLRHLISAAWPQIWGGMSR